MPEQLPITYTPRMAGFREGREGFNKQIREREEKQVMEDWDSTFKKRTQTNEHKNS